MPLFLVSWDEDGPGSAIVDAPSERDALARVQEIYAEDEAPSRVWPFPSGTFIGQMVDHGDESVLELADHVLDIIDTLEDPDAPPPVAAVAGLYCLAEAEIEDDAGPTGEVLHCTRKPDHAGVKHRASNGVEW